VLVVTAGSLLRSRCSLGPRSPPHTPLTVRSRNSGRTAGTPDSDGRIT
jgi:hypothetical protein